MGNDATVLRKIQIGQLQGGVVTVRRAGAGLPGQPALRAADRSSAPTPRWTTCASAWTPTILAGLERQLVAFGLAEGGFAYLMSNGPVRRVARPARAEGLGPGGRRGHADAVRGRPGSAPVVLPLADVYTGLQTGLVDRGRHLAHRARSRCSGTPRRSTSPTCRSIYTAGALVLDKRAFERLAPADQAVDARDADERRSSELDRASRKDDEAARARAQDSTASSSSRPRRRTSARSSASPRTARTEIGRQGPVHAGSPADARGPPARLPGQGQCRRRRTLTRPARACPARAARPRARRRSRTRCSSSCSRCSSSSPSARSCCASLQRGPGLGRSADAAAGAVGRRARRGRREPRERAHHHRRGVPLPPAAASSSRVGAATALFASGDLRRARLPGRPLRAVRARGRRGRVRPRARAGWRALILPLGFALIAAALCAPRGRKLARLAARERP